MLKIYARHGMEVVKVHTVISFKQRKWLENYISFITQKRNKAKNELQKDFYILLNEAFYGKAVENVPNCKKVDFIKKDDTDQVIKQQCKLTFNANHKSYESWDSYTVKQNEIVMDKRIYLRFSGLELGKLLMYETYYDKLQLYFGLEDLQLHYMDTDSFVLSAKTKDFIKDFKKFEDLFDFNNLNENYDLFSNENKKVIGLFQIETPKIIWIDEFVCLKTKMYSFKGGDDSKNKRKRVSKSYSKNIKFDE